MMPGGSSQITNQNVSEKAETYNIVSFEVSADFESVATIKKYSYVYGYVSCVESGALVSLIYKDGGASYLKVSLVSTDIFTELQKIVSKYDFAKSNGFSHYANGLPKSFGGSVDIEYISGDYICFNDNQSPIMSPEAGIEIADTIKRYIDETSIGTLNTNDIIAVRFREDREDGHADYFLKDNILISENKFGNPTNKLFRDEREVPENSIDKVRQMAATGMLLHWKGLKEIPNPVFPNLRQQVIFTMKDGTERTINSNMKGPAPVNNSVFDIQMYLQNTLGQ